MKKILSLTISLTLSLSLPCQSKNVGNDLIDFFKRSGMVSNKTAPQVYKDQAAGYYSGGSIVTRNSVKNAQLATIQMPGFRAGCGGIDMWMGGMSHINAKQLIEALRTVGTNIGSYAFMLGVQTVSPMVYNIVNQLNDLATQINQTNVNSCEFAATTLGGIWPKTDQASKHLCAAMGSNLGMYSDYAASRQGCGAKGDQENVLSKRGKDSPYKDMLVGEFNLAWKVIISNAFLSTDQELARLFMTLVGSIIVRKSGEENYQAVNLPGHADREDVLSGLLNGGATPIYKCDTDDKCLYPTIGSINLVDNQALLTKTHQVLESLITKIYDDTEATKEEMDFLNSTRLPVYKILNVSTAYRKGFAPIDVHQYGELIALDILYKYVLEVIDIIHDSAAQLKSVQVDDAHMDRFLNQLRIARERITERRQNAYQHMDTTLSFIKSTQLIEKQLYVMLGHVAGEDNW